MLPGENEPAVLNQPGRLVVRTVRGGRLLHGGVKGRVAVACAARRHLVLLGVLGAGAGFWESEQGLGSEIAVRI